MQNYEGLGISKKWSRVLKGAALVTAGAATAYYVGPKLVTFLKSKGLSEAAAKVLSDKIAAGQAKLPPDLEAEAARSIPTSLALPTWAMPVGAAAVVIGAMVIAMQKR